MLDYDPQSEAQRIVSEAVARGRIPGAPSRLSGAGGASVSPAGGFTTPGTDEDGNVFDIHDFMTELDDTEDDGALTS